MVELRRSMEQLCKVEIAGGIFVYRYPLQEPLPATTPASLPDICLLPPQCTHPRGWSTRMPRIVAIRATFHISCNLNVSTSGTA